MLTMGAGELLAITRMIQRPLKLLLELSTYVLRLGMRSISLSPAVGSRYFVQHDNELIPLHRLGDIQTFCDDRFGVSLKPGTALDYFRFAYFSPMKGKERFWSNVHRICGSILRCTMREKEGRPPS